MNLKKLLLLFTLLFACIGQAAAALVPKDIYPKAGTTVTQAFNFTYVTLYFNDHVAVDSSSLPTLTNTTDGKVIEATSYSFFDFAYQMEGTNSVRIVFPEPTTNGDYVLTVPAGTISFGGESNEELTYNYKLSDSKLIVATYDPVEILTVTPAQNSEIANLGHITFRFQTTDNSSINFLDWEFYELVPDGDDICLRKNNRNRWTLNGNALASGTKDQWTSDINFEVGGFEPLYSDKEYEMRVKFYAMGLTPTDVANDVRHFLPTPEEYGPSQVGECIVKIKGATKAYEFSDVTFTVSPDPDKYVIENVNLGMFTFTFTAPVTCGYFKISLGNNVMAQGGEAVSNTDGTVWYLTLDPAQIQEALKENSNIFWGVGFNDSEGRRVRGNDDISAGANSITTYNTYCDNTTPRLKLVSPISDMDNMIPELSRIVVTNEAGLEMRKAFTKEKVRLVNRFGQEFVVFSDEDIAVNPDNNSEMIFTLPEPIALNGNLIIIIPSEFLLIMNGSEQGFAYNVQFTSEFWLKKVAAVIPDYKPVKVVPESGSSVSALKEITLTFEDMVDTPASQDDSGHYGTKKASLYKGESVLLEETEVGLDDFDFKAAVVRFSKEYTEAGVYRVVIPQGAFCDDEFNTSGGNEGRINPELVYTYTVADPSGVEAVESVSDTADVYGIDGTVVARGVSGKELNGLPAGLYIFNGRKIVVK